MGEPQRREPLLGSLARLPWFTQQGEVAATRALEILLKERQLRDALLRHLGRVTQTDLRAVESFHAELVHDDRRRPDLEGQDSDERPLVVVEAKFGALLTSDQVDAYLRHQEDRLTGDVRGALILLVPVYRKPEAEKLLRALRNRVDAQSAVTPSVSPAVVTWSDWLSGWKKAAQELPTDEREAVLGDLSQLRALCETMGELDIPPLGKLAVPEDWEKREPHLRQLVKDATTQYRELSSNRLLPIQKEDEYSFYRRYIPGGPPDPGCFCAVGVTGAFASVGTTPTPFWLRYASNTASFPEVRRRIKSSRFRDDLVGDGGHLWLPLQVPDDVSGAAIIEKLVLKIDEIRAVAAGRESP